MEANTFIERLKADGTPKDLLDLDQVSAEYKAILSTLAAKDQGTFSLNVLCVLCRNLEKVVTWSTLVDGKALLALSIDCVRYTRTLGKTDRVKTLACIYHIHKHVVRQNLSIPPELVLKISFMPFENEADKLLQEHVKTYWNILADRLSYLERIKAKKCAIIKLLPKFIEDLQKVILMYDTTQFCTNVLMFVIKKLHFLYNDINPKDLNISYGVIFESISKKTDVKNFRKLSDKEISDIYVKFNECFYVIAENSTKMHFKETVLSNVIRTCMSILGHCPDIFHCFQTFYLNSFCTLLSYQPSLTFLETILNSIATSCEMTEKMSYKIAMYNTYPYLNQFLRLYIEYCIANSEKRKWSSNFTEPIQEGCLKVILFLMDKLKDCGQLLKCDGCTIKTGLHDALRLSFLTKNFISISLSQNVEITKTLPTFFTITQKQYKILVNLRSKGCMNFEKCFKKLQADIHNIAISLNKTVHYKYSIKLFDLYLNNEINHFKNENDLKNISRAFYNKSICELDNKLYEEALTDAHLSLIFSYPEGLNVEKYMSLVMEIKAKVLKKDDDIQDDEDQDEFQLLTVADTCEKMVEGSGYGNLKPFFCDLKFSALLKHEFKMYVKLWPSIVPIAGVWKSLYGLLMKKPVWWTTSAKEDILQTLYEVVLETPTAVRTVHSEYYSNIVAALLDNLEKQPATSPDLRVVHATLLFLKSEYDLHEASIKYGWKVTETTTDPDIVRPTRTLSQEYEAIKSALRAVDIWTSLVKELETIPSTPLLQHALQTAQVFTAQLLHLSFETQGLQLAHVCCMLAKHLDDRLSYTRNAGTLLYSARRRIPALDVMITDCCKYYTDLVDSDAESALVFLADCAIYYVRCGHTGMASKLTQVAQARLLQAYQKNPDINLELAVGRLMEAQALLCQNGGLSALSVVFGLQRHYLTIVNTGASWSSRRHRALSGRLSCSRWSLLSARTSAAHSWRRARAAAGAGAGSASAGGAGGLYAAIVNTHAGQDAQVKIDNRLKYILGLQQSPDIEPKTKGIESKMEFTPKHDIETMLENIFRRTQTSPSVPCYTVPAFKIPDYLTHNSKCVCYACQNPNCQILTCQTCGLEASMYFRAKEYDISKNYYEGTIKSLNITENKLELFLKNQKFESYVLDIASDIYRSEFKRVQIQIFVEASLFELSQQNHKMADEYVVRIHELLQDGTDIDGYLRNDILNVMCATAKLRNVIKTAPTTGLEIDMEGLKLTPEKDIPLSVQKTPETKHVVPIKQTNIVIKKEELPSTKIKVPKLNLDASKTEEIEEKPKKRVSKRNVFKIPIPVTSKPVLETITPRKPVVLITQATIDNDVTPKPKPKAETEFFTPIDTPEQFFTPMTSVKTYSKRSLRQNIVKNLEAEFSTPKMKEKLSAPSNIGINFKENSSKPSNTGLDKENLTKPGNTGINKENLSKPTNRTNLPKPGNTEATEVSRKSRKGETSAKEKERRTLKRATSPGKLEDKKPVTRLRRPVRLNSEENL